MTRNEIRLRALRAAVAVSLTVGLVGCAAAIELEDGSGSDGEQEGDEASTGDSSPDGPTTAASGGASAASSGDAPSEPDAGVDAPSEPDAGVDTADAAADASQVDCTLASDYSACCIEQGWSPEAGCMAWGPPMPPAMGVA
jgi:hypothetical protein